MRRAWATASLLSAVTALGAGTGWAPGFRSDPAAWRGQPPPGMPNPVTSPRQETAARRSSPDCRPGSCRGIRASRRGCRPARPGPARTRARPVSSPRSNGCQRQFRPSALREKVRDRAERLQRPRRRTRERVAPARRPRALHDIRNRHGPVHRRPPAQLGRLPLPAAQTAPRVEFPVRGGAQARTRCASRGRFRGHRLAAGRYALVINVVDLDGDSSRAKRARFRIRR